MPRFEEAQLLTNLGYCRYRIGHLDDALVDLREARMKVPWMEQAWLNEARTLVGLSRAKAAEAVLAEWESRFGVLPERVKVGILTPPAQQVALGTPRKPNEKESETPGDASSASGQSPAATDAPAPQPEDDSKEGLKDGLDGGIHPDASGRIPDSTGNAMPAAE